MRLLLKEYRLSRRLSLKQLSDYTGYSTSFLSLIETHKESPRLITLKKIGYALQICPKKLIYSCSCMKSCNKCYFK
jgi:transcriptional regulator with XRE-family HTH domain